MSCRATAVLARNSSSRQALMESFSSLGKISPGKQKLNALFYCGFGEASAGKSYESGGFAAIAFQSTSSLAGWAGKRQTVELGAAWRPRKRFDRAQSGNSAGRDGGLSGMEGTSAQPLPNAGLVGIYRGNGSQPGRWK